MERQGIGFAGNLVVDFIKNIDAYPEVSMLANITGTDQCAGGLASNSSVAFRRLGGDIPVNVYGRTGDDESGEYLRALLEREGISTAGIIPTGDAPTSYTDVFTLASSGERTFFHNRGANARFSPEDICLPEMNERILHIGYILLLDSFDRPDPEYGTAMARFLARAREAGLKTSVDVVSEQGERFRSHVLPALPYLDYFILNETEAGLAAGIGPRDSSGALDAGAVERMLSFFREAGVREMACVHAPEGSYCMGNDGKLLYAPSADIPAGTIKGKVGAGDAFAAGMLWAVYNDMGLLEGMELAHGAAALCMRGGNIHIGAGTAEQALALYKKYRPKG